MTDYPQCYLEVVSWISRNVLYAPVPGATRSVRRASTALHTACTRYRGGRSDSRSEGHSSRCRCSAPCWFTSTTRSTRGLIRARETRVLCKTVTTGLCYTAIARADAQSQQFRYRLVQRLLVNRLLSVPTKRLARSYSHIVFGSARDFSLHTKTTSRFQEALIELERVVLQ